MLESLYIENLTAFANADLHFGKHLMSSSAKTEPANHIS